MIATSSEEQLLEFLYACPVGLVECDAAGEIGMINPHAMQHLLPLAGARDATNLFAILERHAPELRRLVAVFPRPSGRICEGHRIVVDLGGGNRGKPKVLACTLMKLGPDRLMATIADISLQIEQEQRLRQADAWFASLLDQINDYAVVTVLLTGEIDTANDAFTRLTGHDCADVRGRPLAIVLAEEGAGDDAGLADQLAIAARDGWHLREGWQYRASGERYWCQRLVVARIDAGAMPATFSVVLRDVPPRGPATEDLRRLLTCDHLTGAANRMHFSQSLQRARALWAERSHPLALVTLDLDHFKAVNDTHGHPVGDRVLCRVSEACAALLPPRGTFARLGGEEFGILLPHHGLDQAMALAETLRLAIAALAVPGARGIVTPTASFGCATLDEVAGCADALIALADERLYAAKRDGRNRVHHPVLRVA